MTAVMALRNRFERTWATGSALLVVLVLIVIGDALAEWFARMVSGR